MPPSRNPSASGAGRPSGTAATVGQGLPGQQRIADGQRNNYEKLNISRAEGWRDAAERGHPPATPHDPRSAESHVDLAGNPLGEGRGDRLGTSVRAGVLGPPVQPPLPAGIGQEQRAQRQDDDDGSDRKREPE